MSWTSWLSSGDSSSARARNLTGAHIRWAAVTKYEFSASSSQHRRCLNLNQCGWCTVTHRLHPTSVQPFARYLVKSSLPASSIKTSNKRKAMVEGGAKGIALPRYFLPRANHHSRCPFPRPPSVRRCGLAGAGCMPLKSRAASVRTHTRTHALVVARTGIRLSLSMILTTPPARTRPPTLPCPVRPISWHWPSASTRTLTTTGEAPPPLISAHLYAWPWRHRCFCARH